MMSSLGRRISLIVALLLVIVMALGHTANAAAGIPVQPAVNLHMHDSPSATSLVIATVPAGTMLTAVARDVSTLWILVNYQGTPGWLYAPFLIRTSPLASLPIAFDTSGAPSSNGGVTATAMLTMNIRGGPGTQYELLGKLLQGQTVTLDGKTGHWYRYQWQGIYKGWLFSGLVLITGDPSMLPNVTYP